MPSTRRREEKSAAPSPSPARALRALSAASETSVTSGAHVPDSVEETDEEHVEEDEHTEEHDEESAEQEDPEEQEGDKRKPTLQERQAKLKELRLRMVSRPPWFITDIIRTLQQPRTAKISSRTTRSRRSPPRSFSAWRSRGSWRRLCV